MQSLLQTYNRYRTILTHTISALPIVILMPHSACNCRCVMCDIWKGNQNLKQLTEADIQGLLSSLINFGTQQVVMSGGEALLNNSFFRFCEILQKENIQITLLTTGLTIKKNASKLIQYVNEMIVSVDGDEALHNRIRNIPTAFQQLKEGIDYIKLLKPDYKITGRTVIHKLNYKSWSNIIESAKELQLETISFLPADVSSQAFNREIPWVEGRQNEIMIGIDELPDLKMIIERLVNRFQAEFSNGFIAESPEKIKMIYMYYRALHGLNSFPYKKCNAPWVSTVVEADGSVKPCFFHSAIGNLKGDSLQNILNSNIAHDFRKNLDMDTNTTCIKCVCYLNLKPTHNLLGN